MMKISLGKQTSNVEVELSPNFCISTFMYLYLRQTVEVVASSQPPVPRILLLYHHPSHWAKYSSKTLRNLNFQKISAKLAQNWFIQTTATSKTYFFDMAGNSNGVLPKMSVLLSVQLTPYFSIRNY